MKGKYGSVTARVESITPQKAKEWLKCNSENRKPRKAYVRFLAEVMQKGDWVLTGETIIFRQDGVLVDGQQRLMAVVMSEMTIDAVVVRGVGSDAYHGVDIGTSRNGEDITGLSRCLCEIIKAYNVYILGEGSRMSHADYEEVYTPRSDCFDMAARFRPHKRGIGVAPLWAAVVMYAENNMRGASLFASDMCSAISEVRHCNALKSWIYEQDGFAGGKQQHKLVRHALFCMDRHNACLSIDRVGELTPKQAFK